MLVTASLDKSVKLWNLQSENCVKTLQHFENPIYCVRVIRGALFVGGYASKLLVYSTPDQFADIPTPTVVNCFCEWNSGLAIAMESKDVLVLRQKVAKSKEISGDHEI